MLTLNIDTREKHTISPYLYMQFMEPLGVCDSSVDAAWDFVEDKWQPAVIRKVRELAPTMVRFGGCFASYYHWKEAVGPMKSRIPMINYCWGGMHMNHVGTHEVIDFCRQVDAEPMMVVNMESDGRMHWAYPKNGEDRFGTAEEAAQWVDYCNNPDNALRLSHGIKEPYNIKYWQIGNETSYDKRGYNVDQCAAATERFIREMRKADPSIKLIGWGDNQLNSTPSEQTDSWCRRISQIDGLDMVAFHHHFGSGLPDSPLKSTDYRLDFEKTWEHLMHAHKSMDEHIQRMRADCGGLRLAMTEGHFGVPGRNRNEVLSTWGAGVAYARCHNVLMRNSDILNVATLADFFGNVWQVNALLFPNNVPFGEPYFQPVAHVMSLFRHHQGEKALDVSCNGAVDVTASKTGNTIYLHIANTDMNSAQNITLNVGHNVIESAKMYYIAAKADTEITQDRTDCFPVRGKAIEGNTVILPAAAVAAIEINLKEV